MVNLKSGVGYKEPNLFFYEVYYLSEGIFTVIVYAISRILQVHSDIKRYDTVFFFLLIMSP